MRTPLRAELLTSALTAVMVLSLIALGFFTPASAATAGWTSDKGCPSGCQVVARIVDIER